MSILITSAMSAKAHSLKNQLNNDDIILGDYHEVPEFMLSAKFIGLPDPSSASYAHQILTLCLDNSIKTIYILDGNEARQLVKTQQLFAEYDIRINTDEI